MCNCRKAVEVRFGFVEEIIAQTRDPSPFGHKRPFQANGVHPIGDVLGCFDGDQVSFQLRQPNLASIRPRCRKLPSEVTTLSAI